MKEDKETDEEGKKRGASMERSQAGANKMSPDSLSHPNQNTKLTICYYFIRYGKSSMKFN